MQISAPIRCRVPWLHLPLGMLILLLQRTPVLRVLTGAGEYALSSPAGQILRAAVTAAALGAMHSRAGATTYIQSPGNPVPGTVGTPLQMAFTYNGTPSPPASFQVSGTLPPGLSFIPAPMLGTIPSGTPAIGGTPTQAGTFTVFVQGFNAEGLTNNIQQPITFEITGGGAAISPSITSQPQSQAAAGGATVAFSVTATGEPAPTYQWFKDGTNIDGATSATLTLTNVQPANSGMYTVVATNSAGSVTSTAATLTVTTGADAPAMTLQPVSQTIASGSTVVFSVAASNATGFQWRRDTVNLAGANSATLVIPGATDSNAGTYTCVVTGTGGASTTSAGAALTVISTPNFGRLINLSILADIPDAGDSFTLGYVVGGAGTTGAKPLVIRAAGPSLGELGVPGTLDDPKIELFAGSTKTAENERWGGSAGLAAAMAAVGAFPYMGATSLDAAAAVDILTSDNSVKVSAAGSGTGTVIAEIYDATPPTAFGAATPRLVNVSVIKHIDAGPTGLTAGFVVGGQTARTVLVRAIGPGLAAFGVDGFMPDPQLALFNSAQVRIAENDNWGGDAQLTNAAAAVGAFPIADAGSRDAILLITLAPGNYTAQATGVGAGGSALVEVYEVP